MAVAYQPGQERRVRRASGAAESVRHRTVRHSRSGRIPAGRILVRGQAQRRLARRRRQHSSRLPGTPHGRTC